MEMVIGPNWLNLEAEQNLSSKPRLAEAAQS
ncbi:hypothetical protein COLO4_21050 [Corchorus olitorius]|uniref:Uncharacterized protein n=1 Tax=Corchorus olitorius TaxID=93759 RepID=A0A1R3IVK4_9ROSI|nr:hypothetical protein COLO4_21050 [Corchorus olitorius]